MLKIIDPLLTGDLLAILADMGHGDELAVVDRNFPAAASATQLVQLPGVPATDVLRAILTLLPLDDFVDAPAAVMAAPGERPTIYAEFDTILANAEGSSVKVEVIDRFAFYDRAKAAFAVVLTGESRLYGNVLLKKGVVRA